MFSAIGWITNSVLGWAVPGLGPKTLYVAAAGLVIALCSSWTYFAGAEGKSAAVARCESACTVKIANIQTAAERTILDIVTSVDEAGTGSKDVQQYCQKHPTLCRGEK